MLALLLLAAVAQDVPGSSPMNYSALSRATTSSQIDNDVLGDVARSDRRAARPRAAVRTRSSTRAERDRLIRTDPVFRARYYRQSAPVYRRMGIRPDPRCR